MPKRPPSRQSSGKSVQQTDQSQWVFIFNDKVLEFNNNDKKKPHICQIRHPKTDDAALYLFSPDGNDVYELIQYKEEFRSWLIGETVQQDGGIIITSRVDPVFLILPYLLHNDKNSKFMTLDQIVVDEKYSECHKLVDCQRLEELNHVADIKGDEDFKAYRYNEDKALAWLTKKVEKLTDHLLEKGLHVNNAQSSNFVKSKKEKNIDRDTYRKYSYGIIADYLPLTISSKLKSHLGIPEVEEKENLNKSTEEPPAKRVKLEDIKPLEDYSKSDEKKPTLAKKLSTAQKKLDKVDTKGMKSLASFFSPKSKSK